MFEIFKLFWDVVVLRDAARKGDLNLRTMLYGFGIVALLYGTGLPATLLYQAHPEYKPLFIATLIFDALALVGFLVWWFKKGRKNAAR